MGLEAGLVLLNDLFHLVCVAALTDKYGNVYVGVSKKLPLPKKVSESIKKNDQFGLVIREYKQSLGASCDRNIFELIEELICRRNSFIEAIESVLLQFQHKTLFT